MAWVLEVGLVCICSILVAAMACSQRTCTYLAHRLAVGHIFLRMVPNIHDYCHWVDAHFEGAEILIVNMHNPTRCVCYRSQNCLRNCCQMYFSYCFLRLGALN